jgi:hypothetical protein
MAVKPKAKWYRLDAKRWHMRQLEPDGHENGEGWIDQEPGGFTWATSYWKVDRKGDGEEVGAQGKETTYDQAKRKILAFYKIRPSEVEFRSKSGLKVVQASDVEPKPKAPPRPTVIKKTSKASKASRPPKRKKRRTSFLIRWLGRGQG